MPRCDSRTGASHLRRGAPCQDASGLWLFRDGGGDPIQVLVVSDGHGGSRYVRSDVGSRLACEVALRTVEQTLRSSRTAQAGSEAEWRQWLAESLPQAIVEAWLEEVQRHWQAQGPGLAAASEAVPEPASTAAFSPIPYGATLGLLVLTPSWWGHTGLGDWDLVRIEASGLGRLISEEPEAEGGGEATYSLCMRGAARHFAPRSGLQPLSPEEPPFSLLLSTDGIRKSCGTDADYLTLAHYLTELPVKPSSGEASELSSALDHISSQGSGDDVSVAIGRWGDTVQQRGRAKRGGRGEPLIVQPPPPPVALPDNASASRLSGGEAVPEGATPTRRARTPGRRQHGLPPSWRLLLLGGSLLALLVGAGLLWAARQGGEPLVDSEPEAPVLTDMQQQQLQRKVNELCGEDADAEAIRGTLSNQKLTFKRIREEGEPEVRALLAASPQDPLGALIAWSRLEPILAFGLRPLLLDSAGTSSAGDQRGVRWPLMQGAPGVEWAPAAPQLRLCRELSLALRRQWAQSSAEGHLPVPGAAGSRPAATRSAGSGSAGTGGSSSVSTPAQRLSSGSGLPPSTLQPGPTSVPSEGSGVQDSSDPNRLSR